MPGCSPVVIGVVGDSGAGKTTLLESLIPAVQGRGLRVAAVKHASHGFVADRPGKDSHRLYEAGAAAVAVVSGEQVAVFRRAHCAPASDPSLSLALAALPEPLDVVLVEGFAWEPIPRFVVVRGREAPRRELLARGPLLAVVRVTGQPDGVRPVYSHARIERLVDDVVRRVRSRWPSPELSAPEARLSS